MHKDEEQIRALVTTWLAATRSGDIDSVMDLVADDVVFLRPGHAPMLRAEFEAASRAQAQPGGPQIDGVSEIQEIQVLGDWAYLWSWLTITVKPAGAPAVERAGHTLTVLRKQRGHWVIARDANLLAPVQQPQPGA